MLLLLYWPWLTLLVWLCHEVQPYCPGSRNYLHTFAMYLSRSLVRFFAQRVHVGFNKSLHAWGSTARLKQLLDVIHRGGSSVKETIHLSERTPGTEKALHWWEYSNRTNSSIHQ